MIRAVVTGASVAASAVVSTHLPIFAQTVAGNLTPLMLMAALAWIGRTIRGARINYRSLCETVERLERKMVNIEKAVNDRGKRRGKGGRDA